MLLSIDEARWIVQAHATHVTVSIVQEVVVHGSFRKVVSWLLLDLLVNDIAQGWLVLIALLVSITKKVIHIVEVILVFFDLVY